jgi:hypothetical protein
MKYKILLALCFLIPLVSAITVYSGDSINLTLNEDYVYYSITGNSSVVDLNIIKSGLNVTIFTDKYYDGSFNLTFFNSKEEAVGSYSSGGSSGKYTSIINPIKNNETINESKDNNVTTNPNQEDNKEDDLEIDWNALIKVGGLLVLFVGITIFWIRKYSKKKKSERRLEKDE